MMTAATAIVMHATTSTAITRLFTVFSFRRLRCGS
jgi:hypothetical protein